MRSFFAVSEEEAIRSMHVNAAKRSVNHILAQRAINQGGEYRHFPANDPKHPGYGALFFRYRGPFTLSAVISCRKAAGR